MSPNIIVPPRWQLPERLATPEDHFFNRRRFLQSVGTMAAGASLLSACVPQAGGAQPASSSAAPASDDLTAPGIYPAARSERFALDRALTDEQVAGRYNNFYEFGTDKERVGERARAFMTRPWQIEVAGLVESPRTYDIDEIERSFPLEERLYRHRCVEAWAMAVPWTGFPLRLLIDQVKPTREARHVRFVSFLNVEQAPGQSEQHWYPWPYYEGLTMAEAMNELTMVVTGIYGHRLPKQHGAPVRIVTPWKYGYKSIKSIVQIEFVAEQPATFWNDLAPDEYSYTSNVDPTVPHPRWSQATERLIGSEERVPTQPFNGYGEWVADLYA